MDQLIIQNLELFGFHGVYDEEKSIGQKFIVEAKISLDLSEAGETDNLQSGIHYGQLCHELQEVFNKTKHNLIERAATVLCEHILTTYDQVVEVDLTLKKPWHRFISHRLSGSTTRPPMAQRLHRCRRQHGRQGLQHRNRHEDHR